MMAMIQPGATFRDNLQQLPPVDGVQRIDLVNANGAVVASIENQPGKQGSLAVYQYLSRPLALWMQRRPNTACWCLPSIPWMPATAPARIRMSIDCWRLRLAVIRYQSKSWTNAADLLLKASRPSWHHKTGDRRKSRYSCFQVKRWQATCRSGWPAKGRRSGVWTRHCSITWGQRAANRHPGPMSTGEGISPVIVVDLRLRSRLGSGSGFEAIRICV